MKLLESISLGEVIPKLEIHQDQEPELGAQYQVAVKFPWLRGDD